MQNDQQGFLLGSTTPPQPSPAPGITIHVAGDYIATGDKVQGDKIGGDQYAIDTVGNLNTGNVTIHGDQTSES